MVGSTTCAPWRARVAGAPGPAEPARLPRAPLARPHREPATYAERGGRRGPVGRRGQGQDRRPADAVCGRGGPVPGRQQRRTHAGGGRREDRPAPHPGGDPARGQGLRHRQRGGGRSRGADPARSTGSSRRASCRTTASSWSRSTPTSSCPGTRPSTWPARRPWARARSAPPAAASAPPTRTRWPGAGLRIRDLLDEDRLRRKVTDARGPGARGAGAAGRVGRPRRGGAGAARRRAGPPHRAPRRRRLAVAVPGREGRALAPVRGRAGHAPRRGPRHLSVRHQLQHGGRQRGGRLGPGAARGRLRAGHLQGVLDAGRLRAVPDRAPGRDRGAAAQDRQRVRRHHRAARAGPAGWTRWRCASPSASTGSTVWRSPSSTS